MTRVVPLFLLTVAACSNAGAAPTKARKKADIVKASGCPVGTWDFEAGSLDGATLEPLSEFHNVTVVQPLRVAGAPGGGSALGASLRVGPGTGNSGFASFRVKLPLCVPAGQKVDTYRKKFSARFYVQADRAPGREEGVDIDVWPHVPPNNSVPLGQWITVTGDLSTPGIPQSLYADAERFMFTFGARKLASPMTLTIWIDDVRLN